MIEYDEFDTNKEGLQKLFEVVATKAGVELDPYSCKFEEAFLAVTFLDPTTKIKSKPDSLGFKYTFQWYDSKVNYVFVRDNEDERVYTGQIYNKLREYNRALDIKWIISIKLKELLEKLTPPILIDSTDEALSDFDSIDFSKLR